MSSVTKRADTNRENQQHGGKWKTGFGGLLTAAYKAKRKKARKAAKKSRSRNRRG